MHITSLLQVMEAEMVLINEMTGLERRMLVSLLNRNSSEVQTCQEQYFQLSAHIQQAEDIRLSILQKTALSLGSPSHNNQILSSIELMARIEHYLDPESRQTLQDCKRRFRQSLGQLINSNNALKVYTEAQLITLDSFLTELFPDRADGTYGSDGRQRTTMRPQVLNTQV